MSELEGVVDFYPQIYLVSGGRYMGCIDKSFKRDIREVNGYPYAKNKRNRWGRRFYPQIYAFDLLRPYMGWIAKSFQGMGGAFLEKFVGQIDIMINGLGKKFGIW